MIRMPTAEEFAAVQQALADALERNGALAGELCVVRTERDLLKEQLNRFKRQLFDAKSEASAAHQKDLFFNEAEVEGAQAQPAAAETEDERVFPPGTTARTPSMAPSAACRGPSRSSRERTTTMPSIPGHAAIARMARDATVSPSSSRNCLGIAPPRRVDLPAATTMATAPLMAR